MLDSFTGDDLFSQLLMLRAANKSTILLVEGDSDCNALSAHVDPSECSIQPGHGKKNVIRAIGLVDELDVDDVLAILDRDFDGIATPVCGSNNIVYTDSYDLDSMILLCSGLCERIVWNLSDRRRVAGHLASCGLRGPLDLCIKLAFPLGVLRCISEQHRYGLNMQDLPVDQWISEDGQLDLERAFTVILARGSSASVTVPILADKVQREMVRIRNHPAYCSGRDMMRVLQALITKHWNGKKVSADNLARMVRLAFGKEDLRSTQLYQSVQIWAEARSVVIWCD